MKGWTRIRLFLRGFLTLGMLAVCLTLAGAFLSPAYSGVLGWWQYGAWVAACVVLAFVSDHRRER